MKQGRVGREEERERREGTESGEGGGRACADPSTQLPLARQVARVSAEERCIELQAKLQAISLQMSRFLGGDPAARDALLETSRELAAAGIIGAAFSFEDITVVAASTTAAAAAPTAAVATTATDVAASLNWLCR